VELKETTQGFVLFDKGEVAPTTEIHERVEPALEGSEGVGTTSVWKYYHP